MTVLLNLAYACLLSFFVIRAAVPRWQRMDILGGFWSKLLGKTPKLPDNRPVIWFHAVSVGEALLCQPLVEWLRVHRAEFQIAISVSTPDGLEIARKTFPNDTVFFAPYDFSWAVKRVYRALAPRMLLISENDFWPNLMSQAKNRGIPIVIFNTRIARREQIEHRYDGWLLVKGLSGVKWWGVVTRKDAKWIRRLFKIGSPPVEVTGSLKCDGILRDRANPRTQALRKTLGFSSTDRILVAGSTHAPEEEELVRIVYSLIPEWPDLRLVLVPRNANRFDSIATMIAQQGIPFVRHSERPGHRGTPAAITLVDSMGLLRDLWGLADFGFVGGSLARHGGQNMIEPASYGVPICFGPHTWNFASVSAELISRKAAIRVESFDALRSVLIRWLADPAAMIPVGENAIEYVRQSTHAVTKTVQAVDALLPPRQEVPHTHATPVELLSGQGIERLTTCQESCVTR